MGNKNSFLSEFMSKIIVGQTNKKLIIIQNSNNKIKRKLAFLLRNGYIYGYKMELNTGLIWIFLKYCLENNQVIKKVIFYSKPGKKIYLSIYKLGALSFLNKLSFIIVSTSKGILTIEEALLQDLGGELLFKVN